MVKEKSSTTEPKKDDQQKPSKVSIQDLIKAASTSEGKRGRGFSRKRMRK